MTTIKIVKTPPIYALIVSATANADQTIMIAMEEGKQAASFKLGRFPVCTGRKPGALHQIIEARTERTASFLLCRGFNPPSRRALFCWM